MHNTTAEYTPISHVPEHIRFEAEGSAQGQIVEVAYAGQMVWNGTTYLPRWKRVEDRSRAVTDPQRVTYYVAAKAQ